MISVQSDLVKKGRSVDAYTSADEDEETDVEEGYEYEYDSDAREKI